MELAVEKFLALNGNDEILKFYNRCIERKDFISLLKIAQELSYTRFESGKEHHNKRWLDKIMDVWLANTHNYATDKEVVIGMCIRGRMTMDEDKVFQNKEIM